MDLIKILAESYGNGSKSSNDYWAVTDGSETLQDITNNTESPSNTDSGAGQVKDTAQNRPDTNSEQGESGIAGHIKTEDTFPGRDINKSEDPNRKRVSVLDDPDEKDELNTANSANYTTTTYPIDGVDNNHSDGGFGIGGFASLLNIFQKASGEKRQQEQNFFLQNSTGGGVADSPQTMEDGHPYEELIMNERQTVNNPLPGVNDTSVFTDSSAFDFDRKPGDIPTEDRMDRNKEQQISDINKGKGVWAHLTSRPSMISHIPFPKKATGEWQSAYQDVSEYVAPSDETNVPQIMHKDEQQNRYDDERDTLHGDSQSNVNSVMYPDEVEFKQRRVRQDFGNKDYGSENYMAVAPLQNDSNPESQNYSGINGSASLLDIILRKEAYGYAPVGLMPSSNPNSGNDENDTDDDGDEIYGTIQPHRPMTDGKPSYVFDNQSDKEVDDTLSDGAGQMRKRQYNRTEDSDKQDYYGFAGSGSGGMGGEGDGTFSGINNSD